MKIKTFIILVIIALVLSLGGYLLIHFQKSRSSQRMMGRLLFKEFPAERIAIVTIKGPKDSVILKKLQNQWVVQTRLNYPADLNKLSDLVRKLKEAKIGRIFESNEGSLKRLALVDPTKEENEDEEKGIRVIFGDENEQEIKNLIFGKSRETEGMRGTSEGQYLMLQGDTKIYLVDKDFSTLEPISLEWLEKKLVDVQADDVRSILCKSLDGGKIEYHFERPEKGKDFEALEFSAKKKVKKSTLDQLSGALAGLNMENIVDPSSLSGSPIKMSKQIEYRLFNGLVYRIIPGDTCAEDDSCYLKIEVDYQKPPTPTEEKSDTQAETEKEDKEKQPVQEDLSQEALKLNEQFKPWTYIIPKWKMDALITNVDKLVEKEEKQTNKK
jgi:hypothetical protein